MFARVLVFMAVLAAVSAFRAGSRVSMKMASQKISKAASAAAVASGLIVGGVMPSFAVEGAAPKQGFFGVLDNAASSPYANNEKREDPLYSPYSPYGNGDAAVYEQGKAEEVKFWTNQLNNCIKRTENIPKYTKKQQWMNVQTELTSYSYNLREAMLRLADYSSNKEAARSAAQAYFVDINDIFVASKGKEGAKADAIYAKSLDDLKAFKASLQ